MILEKKKMTFQMWDLQDIGLVQWNSHGDHPDVTPLNDPKFDIHPDLSVVDRIDRVSEL